MDLRITRGVTSAAAIADMYADRGLKINAYLQAAITSGQHHYSMQNFPWQVNGDALKFVDERTGMTAFYFDGDGDWLHSEHGTVVGTPFTVAFTAMWDSSPSWSRIMDWGIQQDRDNILIANEGGSRHIIFSIRKWNQERQIRCVNMIDYGEAHHYLFEAEDNGDMRMFKDGALVDCQVR